MVYDLGIIIPVYRSTRSVEQLILQLERLFGTAVRIRICLVDDSNDMRLTGYLKKHCLRRNVSLIVLDGNFGQQAAMLCALRNMDPCRYYATIDDDLEQPPQMLYKMYQQIRTGYDLVYGIPVSRDSSWPGYRKWGSRMRDVLFTGLIGVPRGIKVSSLRVMTRQVARAAVRYQDSGRSGGFFYLSAAAVKGMKCSGHKLKIANLPYRPKRRIEGRSGYSPGRLIRLYGQILCYYGLGMKRPDRIRQEYRMKYMIRKEKLLLLGGSNCQLHGAERASSLGVPTVLADYTEHPPAAAVCTVHERISTFDQEACLAAANRHQVTGVMTMGTDQPVYTAACIAAELGLPAFLTVDQAFAVTNKKRMKQILAAAGIPTAAWQLADRQTQATELSALRPPLVIKPLDSQGQRGIYKLPAAAELLGRLNDTLSFSRCQEALVEEYYDSDEITVSGWLDQGELCVLTVTDRLLYPDKTHIGVCTGHRFPSVYMDRYPEILSLSRQVAAAFDLKRGPFYLQLLVGREGIKVNELAARIGGAFEDVFIPWISGFDILQAVLDSALGRPVDTRVLNGYSPDRSDRCIAVQLLFCTPGIIASMTPSEELQELPYVLDAGYNFDIGQTVPAVENATARFGHAVICGTADTIDGCINDFYRRLSVRSTAGIEMIRRFYP